MKETANSNKVKRSKPLKIKKNLKKFKIDIGPLIRAIKRCPATILAANRTDRVIGRISLLTISIITIKGINATGVPRGTKCEKKKFILYTVE